MGIKEVLTKQIGGKQQWSVFPFVEKHHELVLKIAVILVCFSPVVTGLHLMYIFLFKALGNPIHDYNYILYFSGTLCVLISAFLLIKMMIAHKTDAAIAANIPIALFSVYWFWALICSYKTFNEKETLLGDSGRMEGIITYGFYISLFFAAATVVKNREKFSKTVIYLYAAILALLSGVGIAGSVSESFAKLIPFKPDSMVFAHWNHFGYIIATIGIMTAALIVVSEKLLPKIIFSVFFGAEIVMLVYNRTLGAVVSIAISLVFIIVVTSLWKRKFILPSLIPLVIFAVVFCIFSLTAKRQILDDLTNLVFNDMPSIVTDSANADYAGSTRWSLWKLTAEKIAESPVFGWGIEGVKWYLVDNSLDGSPRTHNEFLQFTAFFGVPGGLLYVSAIISVFIRGLRHRKDLTPLNVAALSGAFAYCVSSAFGCSFPYTATYLYILLGLGYVHVSAVGSLESHDTGVSDSSDSLESSENSENLEVDEQQNLVSPAESEFIS